MTAPRTTRMHKGLALLTLVVASVGWSHSADATPPAIEVTHGVRTGSMPKGVIVSPDGTKIYVTNFGMMNGTNVSIFDARTLARLDTINMPGIAVESVISPDGKMLYVSNFTRNTVQFVDLTTKRVTREVRAGAHPKILTLSHDGTRLFAANWGSANVTEINAQTGAVVRTLRAQVNPRGMAITHAGRLYIANFNSASIDVYEGANMDQHHRIEHVCAIPRHLVLSPDESTLYISCLHDSRVDAMNVSTEHVDHSVRVGLNPKAIDVSPDGRYLYTANYGGSSVSIIDTTDWTASTLDVPAMDHASGIATDRQGVRFFVTGWYDDHVFAVAQTGSGTQYTISTATRARVLHMRELHRLHPAE